MSPQLVVARRETARHDLPDAARALLGSGHRLVLVAGHEDDDALRVVYAFTSARSGPPADLVELVVRVPRHDAWVPSLAALSFPAGRFEREVRDLYGVTPVGHPLPRRLVRHAHWPQGWYPMRRDAGAPEFEPDVGSFPFLEVEGSGVYEIPVGPVHAGLIEPGHFRFSVVGETILRMKARLWFLHRGIEQLFEGRLPAEGVELAERVSGDTAVAHTLAYVMAVESATQTEVAPRMRQVRSLLLELERLHNHVADLGALANDVGLGVVSARAGRLRESLLRLNKETTGHRLLRGAISPGGAQVLALPGTDRLRSLAVDVAELVDLTLGHSVVVDRFTGTAVLPRTQALEMGTLGYVARASGVDIDARRDVPYSEMPDAFRVVRESDGDVLARYRVRAQEYAVSTEVCCQLVERLSTQGPQAVADENRLEAGPGAGLAQVEAWRGTLTSRVEIGANGRLTRVKIVDPSFFNWPALPVALADTIVPDFPLANKSFNQSYAGNDL